MTTAKHTPGPWVGKKGGVYFDTPWSIDHEDGHDASWAAISTPKGRTLALVVNDDSKRPMDFQNEEMHANANLVAAAPEMLEALQSARALWADFLPAGNSNAMKAMKLVDAAIDKALTGESK